VYSFFVVEVGSSSFSYAMANSVIFRVLLLVLNSAYYVGYSNLCCF